MILRDFTYELPEHLIAQNPLLQREKARLMVVRVRSGKIVHDEFAHISQYLPPNSQIVLNNSKVIPARLFGQKERTGGKVEIFLLKKLSDGFSFEVLMKPAARILEGEKIRFNGNGLTAEVIDWKKRVVRFNKKDVVRYLEGIGRMPLPPYIKRSDTKIDEEFYQTVYARYPGSVAAPTAGLHFTKPLLEELTEKGHAFENVTLHVNYATFKPVVDENILEHKMHFEDYSVSPTAWKNIKQAKKEGRTVVSIGTTSCRVLEAVNQSGKLRSETNLFIYPGYTFQMVDALVTNFHLPRSTLLMLVYAFGGMELMKRVYAEAIKKEYRFFSYGDAMLIV